MLGSLQPAACSLQPAHGQRELRGRYMPQRQGCGQLPPFAVEDIRSFEWPLRLEQRTRLLGVHSASIVDIKALYRGRAHYKIG